MYFVCSDLSTYLPPTQVGGSSIHLSHSVHVCVSDPSISGSDAVTLPMYSHSPPFTLQCNLTSSQYPHQQSYWMKNGEEIAETRSDLKDTEYR